MSNEHLELAKKIGVEINPNFDGLPFAPFTARQLLEFYEAKVEIGRSAVTHNVESKLNAKLDFPTWEDAVAGITDSRFVGHPKLDKQQTNGTRAGARIMYDRLYVLLKS